ncbi:alpha/beta hydrolase [Alphaproteobacteria bacterium]|nr:alpha/beta hydrolase [Alphaproteobacteria bacterium]
MSLGFVFHHGWGYDNSYWDNLFPLFSDFPCRFLCAEYYQRDVSVTLSENARVADTVTLVGIGHSIGFVKLLEKEKNLRAIIGLQSFVNFLSDDPQLHKRRSMILEKMIAAFEKYPVEVLREFRQDSSEISVGQLNYDLLLEDLKSLRLKYSVPAGLEHMVLATRDDPVLDASVVEGDFPDKVKFLECPGHCLGYKNAKAVHEEIMKFVDALQ